MKINIYKSDTDIDHLVLVVDWPQDITADIVHFLKKISAIDGESIKQEKANAVAFKLMPLDEEDERGLKLAIINTIRQSLTQVASSRAATEGVVLSKEQISSLLVDMQMAKYENIFLKQELKLRIQHIHYMSVATGAFLIVTILAIILAIIGIFT